MRGIIMNPEILHDMHNAANRANLSIALLMTGHLDEATQQNTLLQLRREIRFVAEMLTSSLNHSKTIAYTGDKELLDLSALVYECVEDLQLEAGNQDIVIHVHGGFFGRKVHGNRAELRRVLLNLLINAIKYNRHDGRVTVLLSIAPEERKPAVLVGVLDTGQGIDASQHTHIFQQFYQVPNTKKQAHGWGLGLASCKQIVEEHGGEIWLDSKPEVGSIFYFTLPLHP